MALNGIRNTKCAAKGLGGAWAIIVIVMAAMVVGPRAGLAQVTLNGAGSSFAYPMYSKWFDAYQKVDSSARFNYQSIGSGAGIRQMIEGTVDFGGTDSPMTDEQMKDFKEKRGANILHFPTALGAILPTFNVPGIGENLNFTPAALAGIYLGKITKWNDPELARANPDVRLPETDIVVIHRSDGSGSTFIWLDYLAKVSPECKQKIGVATSVRWPVGIGAKGNEGVAGLIKQTPGSIGYVELIYALQNKLRYGRVQNAAGKFIEPTLESVTAAAAGAAKSMPSDFRIGITNSPGQNSYPISSFTWLLIPDAVSDPIKKEAVVKFLHWSISKGQELLAPLHYARVPDEVLAMEKEAIARIQ